MICNDIIAFHGTYNRLVASFSHKSVGNFHSANASKKAKGEIMGRKTGSVIIYNVFASFPK